LTIEQILKYVKEDGADINKDSCKALENAVEENDVEKAKVILELGGSLT
jgi:tRNA G37 N-methylase Trm5